MRSRESGARRGFGITGKLVVAIVGSVIIGVAVLLGVVYFQMSRTLLDRSEDLLQATTDIRWQLVPEGPARDEGAEDPVDDSGAGRARHRFALTVQ